MEWNLCNSPPCIPFYPYSMLQNPMPKPSCQKSRETIITQKAIVTQIYNIVHCYWHTPKPICADFEAFSSTVSLFKLMGFFFIFLSGGVKQKAKNLHILLILTGKNALKWLECCMFKSLRHAESNGMGFDSMW